MDLIFITLALIAFAVIIGVLISRKTTKRPPRQPNGGTTRNPPQQN